MQIGETSADKIEAATEAARVGMVRYVRQTWWVDATTTLDIVCI